MSWRTLPLIGAIAATTPAHADPCKASLPSRPEVTFAGTVQYVGDGDSLCVGQTSDPNERIEVRLADFDAPELHSPGGDGAKTTLVMLTLHRPVTCITERGRSGRVVVFDRVIARCWIGQTSIGDLLRQSGVIKGGN